MDKRKKKFIDIALVSIALIVLAVLYLAPEETTTRMPNDQTHQKYYEIYKAEGKKAAGKHCQECHNADGVPFPENHPPKYRCLFCHKLEAGA